VYLEDPPHYPPSSPAPYAPQNGPAPFYVVGGNAPQRPLAQEPTPRIPSASKPHPIQTNSPPPAQYGMQPQAGQRPQSTYVHPAELGTYDPPSGHPYSGSVYSQDEPYSAGPHQPPAQTQYAPYVPPTQQGQQPPQAPYEPSAPPTQAPLPPQAQQQRYNAYAPPSQPPTHDLHAAPDGVPSPVPMNANYPALSSPPPGPDARDSLPSQGGAAYRPFVRPGLSDSVGHGVRRTSGGSATAPGGGEDFYRQSAAY
jgi:signal transducing adaptor molecule